MIKAIIFDVGGVLIRTPDRTSRRRWEDHLGLAPWESEDIVFGSPMGTQAQRGEISDETLWHWVGQRLALSPTELATFRHDFWAGDVLDMDLVQLIRQLRPFYKTAIISNATDGLRHSLTHTYAIADAFDLIVCSAEEKVMKPDPTIFHRTLERLGIQPSEAIFIDDFAHNIVAAQQLGLHTIHFHPGLDMAAALSDLIPFHSNIGPLLPGYTIRPATMADLPAAYDLFNQCAQLLTGTPNSTLADLQQEWEMPDFDLSRSTQVVLTPAGQLVGYVEVWDLNPIPVYPWVWGRVHPDYEGQGIGSYLLTWAEARLHEVFSRVPADARVAMRISALHSNQAAIKLFQSQNMTLVRYFWRMVIELDHEPEAPHWPAGITVVPFAAQPDFMAVYRTLNESFQDHWGHVEQPIEEAIRHWQYLAETDEAFDPNLWFLAMEGEEMAGFCLCRRYSHEDPEMGWIGTLGVRRPWRKQGLGLALLQHAFSTFYRDGRARAGLAVDAASPTGATRLYEKAGMVVAQQYDSYEKELRPGRDLSSQTLP